MKALLADPATYTSRPGDVPGIAVGEIHVEQGLCGKVAALNELGEPLERLLAAVYAFEKDSAPEAPIVEAWEALHRARMEKLVGCLSTPVPRPLD